MILHDWGLLEYELAYVKIQEVHTLALEDGQNHLILCQHPCIYTIGQDAKEIFKVPSFKTDRGGSITSHSPGQNIYYFCFHAPLPAKFFSKIISIYSEFFKIYLPSAHYEKERPGFYIKDTKLLSLGFRYKKGVSLHGVALNVSPALDFHNKIKPCNLEGIRSSSLKEQGLDLSCKEVNEKIVNLILKAFNESL
ncbi:MAG TPA: lipoyl(octanoyl) transferase [Sulfurimonas sp.]|nr:lipoyl(octanoyl) transferase [Sulfurimonas sp.]